MKKMTDKQLKKELLNILIEFDKICKENNIKYSLIGGSLLGAIRHKGFIPWDDDIDVIMTKKNYDKLLENIKNYKGKYSFVNNEINNSYYYPFLKMINKDIYIKEKYKKIDDYGLYIDIFYYAKVPDNKLLLKIYWYKIQYYKFLISSYAYIETQNTKYKTLKKIGKLLCKIYGIDKIIKNYNRNMNKYNKTNSKNIMGNWPCYSLNKEIQKSCYINEYKLIEFEGNKIPIFKNYDCILKTTFNDYMKIPEKKDRKNHGLIGYFK